MTITLRDGEMHYVDEGDRNAPIVLMLHGNPTWSYLYRHMIDPVAAAGYRVIAFDRPGYGHSDRPRSTLWTPEAQADLIHAALAQIGVERATVGLRCPSAPVSRLGSNSSPPSAS